MKNLLFILAIFSCSNLFASRTLYSVNDGFWDDPFVWITADGQAAAPTPHDHVVISHEITQLVNELTYTHYGNVLIEADGAYLINTGKGSANAYIFGGASFEVFGTLITSDDFSHQKGIAGGDGVFYAHEGATVYIGDDYEPHENSLTIVDVNCFVMGDDLKFFGDGSRVCGKGSLCIGPITNIPGTANGEVRAIINGVHTDGFQFVCSNMMVYRIGENGETCDVVVQNGTGENPSLPVELLSFEAVQQEEAVLLSWTTASELNNDFFSLQRGADPQHFETIAEIAGAGTSENMQSYTFTDARPLNGRAYYRLMQTDFDGKTTFSPVIEVHFAPQYAYMQVYPNPIQEDEFHLLLNGFDSNRTVYIQILDMAGRVVFETRRSTDANGMLDEWIPLALKAGKYVLNCESARHFLSHKLIRF